MSIVSAEAGVDNVLSLTASQNSKITKVNIYSGLAEITRRFEFSIKKGQNQVVILGLPCWLQPDFVRVEGRGKASIHDVAIFRTPFDANVNGPEASEAWKSLDRQRKETKRAIQSVQEARAALNTYLGTVKANELEPDKFEAIVNHHETLARKFDLQILDLERELSELTVQAGIEKMNATENSQHRTWQVNVNLWAESDEEVELRIQYVVYNADWSASYDVRAVTQGLAKNITILYKAVITQNTCESWEGVPLTLETMNPTFGLSSPELPPWNVGISLSPMQYQVEKGYGPSAMSVMPEYAKIPAPESVEPSRRSRSSSRSGSHAWQYCCVPSRRDRAPSSVRAQQPVMVHAQIGASNKGNVAASFEVPGYISVPSDGLKHNVTISKFEFDAALLWYTIPKVDATIYIKAKIKNESEFRFIPGPSNVYVDGTFIATTSMPSVNPEETFDCPLGLDPSIRVTYHPRDIMATKTGFVKKSSSTTYTQRITLLNTKSTPIRSVKVVGSIPISQDKCVEIKLLSPSLSPPAPDGLTRKDSTATDGSDGGNSSEGLKIGGSKKQKITRVLLPNQNAKGVVAQWDGINDPDVDQQTVGKNGRVSWIVSLGPQESVTVSLKYEISFPEKTTVYGL